ncbi:MAG TPA: PIG-L deacetylase family protein [Acidimicrobiales bacterium]|jgi:LmbE family N-acetylglucosaminyl deacetylase
MAELVSEVPERVVAVYAHPDDADVASGGTLARWAKAGSEVHLVVCTDGGRGTTDPGVAPSELAGTRAEELAQAAGILGLAAVTSLGWTDGEVEDSADLRGALVEVVRRVRPEAVLGHDPTAVFFGQHYFNHRDHRAVGWATLDAVAPAAALPAYFPDAGPPHQVGVVYLSGTLEPDVWVDVGDTVEMKVAAVERHRSQLGGDEHWAAEVVRQRAREEGRRAGVTYAEGFRRLRLGG